MVKAMAMDQAVRYLDDHRNARRQARIEAQRAARREERRLLLMQALVGVTAFMALTAASGILR